MSVRIYEKQNGQQTTQDEFNAIDSAIKSWNSIKISGCSNVTFDNASRTNTVWAEGDFNHDFNNREVLVVRTELANGGFQVVESATGLKGGWLMMRNSFNHTVIPQGLGPLYRVDNLAKHEAGHSFGIDEGLFGHPPSAMGPLSFTNNILQITACDVDAHKRVYCPTPTPTPTPYPTPDFPGGCYNPVENFSQGSCPLYFSSDSTGYWCCEVGCQYQGPEQVYDPSGYGELDCGVCWDGIDNDCDGGIDDFDWGCDECHPSPIVIDLLGNGFDLSSASNGVDFDISGVGRPRRISWTQGDDAWLALDRNGNGTIDSGKELFGNITYQLNSTERNGFQALVVYDEPANGGNGDGMIKRNDAIFPSLRLWLDANRNGVSESGELHSLSSMNIARIDLDYSTSRRVDEHGNEFRYRARVRDTRDASVGRWAWDVFLTSQPQQSSAANILTREILESKVDIFGSKKSKCARKLPV